MRDGGGSRVLPILMGSCWSGKLGGIDNTVLLMWTSNSMTVIENMIVSVAYCAKSLFDIGVLVNSLSSSSWKMISFLFRLLRRDPWNIGSHTTELVAHGTAYFKSLGTRVLLNQKNRSRP